MQRATASRRRQRPSRWYSQMQRLCVNCRSDDLGPPHHSCYEQHVRDLGGDVDDPDNSMTLCVNCHARHHDGSGFRLDARLLSDENVRFMVHLMGIGRAAAYVRRYYAVDG